MPRGENGKRCENCNRVGVPADATLCKVCRLERDEGPAAARRYLQEIGQKGGQVATAGRPKGLNTRDLPALENNEAAKQWIAAPAEGVAEGRIDLDLAAEVRRQLKSWMTAHKNELFDERMEALEERLVQIERRVERPWE